MLHLYHRRSFSGLGEILEYVIHSDAHSCGNQDVRHHRERGQVFQFPNQIYKDQRDQHCQHDDTNVHVQFVVVIYDLLDISGHKNHINAAAANQVDDQKGVNDKSSKTRPFVQRFRSRQESSLSYVGESQRWNLSPATQQLGAFDQDMDAVRAYDSYDDGRDESEPESRIGKRKWHS